MARRHLFSVTKDDLTIQTFRAGGHGGQHQNKTETGVRVIHKESGARGESREHKSQYRNKREAFLRMTQTDKFQAWMKQKTATMLQDQAELRRKVNRMVSKWIRPANLKVEVWRDGKWIVEDE